MKPARPATDKIQARCRDCGGTVRDYPEHEADGGLCGRCAG